MNPNPRDSLDSPHQPLLVTAPNSLPLFKEVHPPRNRRWVRIGIVAAVAALLLLLVPVALRPSDQVSEERLTAAVLRDLETTLEVVAPASAVLSVSDEPLPLSSYLPGKQILIVQHNLRESELDGASERTHAAYAAAWGYGHLTVPGNHFPQGVHGSINKMYVLRAAMNRELARESSYQWIMYSDSDVIVFDPALPLHVLVPPASYPANILGNEDHEGFNNGVFLLRINAESLKLINAVIDIAERAAQAGVSPDQRNDQTLMAQQLRWNYDFGKMFAIMPQLWLNAYSIDSMENSDEEFQMHVHFVFDNKGRPLRPVLEAAANVAHAAVAAGGLDKLRADAFALRTQQHWNSTKVGVEGVHFYIDEMVDQGTKLAMGLPE